MGGRPFRNLTGERFNMLEVIGQVETPKNKNSKWLCKCDCGKESVVICTKLTKGTTKSCGCERGRRLSEMAKSHGMSKTRLYTTWFGMKARCYHPSDIGYSNYGGRGITICEEWHSFETFSEWATSNGYNDKLTIDRIDNNGSYSPNNCKWSTVTEQSNNRRSSKYLTINGVTKTIAEWSKYSGVKYETIRSRLARGSIGESLISR